MTKYASSDIQAFMNAQCPVGGHLKGDAERLIVNCEACEPLLTAKDSWSSDPFEIPRTQAENVIEQEQVKARERNRTTADEAMAELALEWLKDKRAREQRDAELAAQIRG